MVKQLVSDGAFPEEWVIEWIWIVAGLFGLHIHLAEKLVTYDNDNKFSAVMSFQNLTTIDIEHQVETHINASIKVAIDAPTIWMKESLIMMVLWQWSMTLPWHIMSTLARAHLLHGRQKHAAPQSGPEIVEWDDAATDCGTCLPASRTLMRSRKFARMRQAVHISQSQMACAYVVRLIKNDKWWGTSSE
ncbi:hypothetical protein HD554DRAFT_2040557 [Boletus coccyginus]|nr:hypothetical protein HD554DRAFT_2040557 [Boletus coccyginus]